MEISTLGGISPLQNNNVQKNEIKPDVQTTGAGTTAQNGAVPDPSSPSYQMISSSLAQFFPALTGEQIDIKIVELTMKTQEIAGDVNTNELVAKEEQKRESLAEKASNIKEAEKKMEEAEAKQEKSGFFDKIKVGLQGLGAVVTMAIGAALFFTGVGAGVGVALMALGGLQMLMVIDGIVAKNNDGLGMMGQLFGTIVKATGGSEEQIEKAQMGADITFQILMAVAMIVVSVAMCRADVAGMAAVQLAQGVAAVSAATTGIASSGLAIASAKTNADAAYAQADAQDIQADGQDLQAFNELLNDFIDQILSRISGSNQQFNSMLDDITQSVKDRGDTLARASFTG